MFYHHGIKHTWHIRFILFFLLHLIIFSIEQLKRIFLRKNKNTEEQQKHLQYLHQLELEKSEKEIVALKNEKLQAELQNKNTELGFSTMHLVQKGDLLSKIKEELTRLKKNSGGELGPMILKN